MSGSFVHLTSKCWSLAVTLNTVNMMSSKFLKPCLTKSTTIAKYNWLSLVHIHFVNIYDKEVPSGNNYWPSPKFCYYQKHKKLQKQKFKIRNMKTFDKTKFLNHIKELDNLSLYQYKEVHKMYIWCLSKQTNWDNWQKSPIYNLFKKTVKAKAKILGNLKYSKIYQIKNL